MRQLEPMEAPTSYIGAPLPPNSQWVPIYYSSVIMHAQDKEDQIRRGAHIYI